MSLPADRVVVVAGASGALGRATVAAFAGEGARLGLIGTNAGRLADVAAAADLPAGRWHGAAADVRDAGAVGRAVGDIEGRFGRIDVLLHLVGGFVPGAPITELDPADLTFMLDQHLWSTLHLARAVVPGMVERGWGRILAVSSTTTATTPGRAAVYATAKAAQETLLKVLAKEVGGSGVTVNLIAVRQIDAAHAREREPSPKNATWTTPEEIVAMFRFLASDEAAPVNGVRIALDGRT